MIPPAPSGAHARQQYCPCALRTRGTVEQSRPHRTHNFETISATTHHSGPSQFGCTQRSDSYPLTAVPAHLRIPSPVGDLLLAATSKGITTCAFINPGDTLDPAPQDDPAAQSHVHALANELAEYFAGARRVFQTPLAPRGSPFYQLVWKHLLDIPFGETISYGLLARRVGNPAAARAVGAANGANPIAIVIPCHRVIDSQGKLHGYAGGLHRKRWLLDHEISCLWSTHPTTDRTLIGKPT